MKTTKRVFGTTWPAGTPLRNVKRMKKPHTVNGWTHWATFPDGQRFMLGKDEFR